MLKTFVRRQRDAFLDKHIQRQAIKRFTRKNIYIVPTKAGFGFLFTVCVILFAAINYQNNSLFLFGFSILAIFLLSILATFENLLALELKHGSAELIQQGEKTRFKLLLSKTNKKYCHSLTLFFEDKDIVVDEIDGVTQSLTITLAANKRGIHYLPRFKLETRFPFGLIRAWSYAQITAKVYVYPSPVQADMDELSGHIDQKQIRKIESNDFVNIRQWHVGESPKRILWPAFARTNELLALDYDFQSPSPAVLDWHSIDGDDETKLKILSFWILHYSQAGHPFSLKLPYLELAMDEGESAKIRALKALASFGYDDYE